MERNERPRKEFTELSKAKIRENRNLVISKDNLGFVTIAQQLVIEEDGRETAVFLKGAIEINVNNLREVYQAIETAIIQLEKN